MRQPDPRNIRDMLLEAGYSADEVELGLRALNHGKQDADDLSEAYFWLCAVAGWTFAGPRVTPRHDILRVARRLNAGYWRDDGAPENTAPLWGGVRSFGTESP
jgi:hypothetical protein